jgi:hypothetical protein
VGAVAAISIAGVIMYSWYGITSWRAILAADAARAEGDSVSGTDDDGSADRSDRPES